MAACPLPADAEAVSGDILRDLACFELAKLCASSLLYQAKHWALQPCMTVPSRPGGVTSWPLVAFPGRW